MSGRQDKQNGNMLPPTKDALLRTSDDNTGDIEAYDPDFDVRETINGQEIDHPPYYNQGKIEVIDFIEDQAHLGFCRQIAIKYICRSGKKDGELRCKDLLKAIWYLGREIEQSRKGES